MGHSCLSVEIIYCSEQLLKVKSGDFFRKRIRLNIFSEIWILVVLCNDISNFYNFIILGDSCRIFFLSYKFHKRLFVKKLVKVNFSLEWGDSILIFLFKKHLHCKAICGIIWNNKVYICKSAWTNFSGNEISLYTFYLGSIRDR